MKKKEIKKIIISSYDDLKNPVYAGGGAQAVHQLAKRLAEKFEITVITGVYKNSKDEIIDNVKYARVGSDLFGHKIGQLLYQFSLLKYARTNDFDLWIESTTPPFTFSSLPLFSKKPVISWVNMLCSYDMQRKYKLNFRSIEEKLCKLYKYIITPTGWVKNEIYKMNPNADVSIITPGFESYSKNNVVLKKELKNYLLFIGRIEIDQKGLDLLIQSISIAGENTKVIIAGMGSKKEEKLLNKLITEYNVGTKCILVGRIGGNEKEILLSNVKAVIIPSRFETFSLTALEAIMHKKPIICFNIPQLEWISKEYSVKITPFNIHSMAAAIDNILTTKTKEKKVIYKNQNILNSYTWENTAKNFESYFLKIQK